MQLPLLGVGDLDHRQADAAEHFQVGTRVSLDLGDAAQQEDQHVHAALDQGAGDDEAVAAVVAAAAEHADAALRQVLERRFHRGDRLAPGILHQHDRRNADFLDRPAIGVPHLSCVQHPHQQSSVSLVLDCGQFDVFARKSHDCGDPARSAMRGAVYVNGTITPADQAVIPVFDHGFMYGEGVYEVLRTYDGAPFLFDRHVARLRNSARYLHLDVPFDDAELQRWGDATAAAAQLEGDTYIRILLTRGIGDLSYDVRSTAAPSVVIVVKPQEAP